MHARLSLTLLALPAAPLAPPEPKPVVGDALLPGAVARLGPTNFYYAGWVNVLHTGGTPTVWYSQDGKRVAVTSGAGAFVWDADTGKRLLWVPSDDTNGAAVLGFHPDGDVFVHCFRTSSDYGGVFRIDPVTGKVKGQFIPDTRRWFGSVSP